MSAVSGFDPSLFVYKKKNNRRDLTVLLVDGEGGIDVWF